MEQLFSRGAFSPDGTVKIFGPHGSPIHVDPSTFVETVNKLQALVDNASSHLIRLAVRTLWDMALERRNSGMIMTLRQDIAEVLSDFVECDGHNMHLTVSDEKCRIILDALVVSHCFSFPPRMNPAILAQVEAMSPHHEDPIGFAETIEVSAAADIPGSHVI